jgi:GNAT superfamily N-acetyltransferase
MVGATSRSKPVMPLRYAVTTPSKGGARNIILKGFLAYNRSKAGRTKLKPMAVVLRDGKGRVLGGLTGSTAWGWMYVELFWLPEELRHQGHGRKLMALAEAEAKRRGCIGIYLNTTSFQSPGFYGKLGFKAYAVIDDYPSGHKTYFLAKRLTDVRRNRPPRHLFPGAEQT